MEIISIDISGKFAHFRKFYANNTALSYFIPPRTTIMGMLAAILGKDKNSYYESMASDKLRIGIRVLSPLKKSFHRLNLLKILGSGDFRGKQGRVQTPFEVVTGIRVGADDVKYRIYLSCFEDGKVILNELKFAFQEYNFKYNLTLGTANFSASVSEFHVYDKSQIELKEAGETFLSIHSAICSNKVSEINFEKNKKIFIEEELIPGDFIANNNREVSKMYRVIYSIDDQPIPVKLKGEYYKLTGLKETELITFIE